MASDAQLKGDSIAEQGKRNRPLPLHPIPKNKINNRKFLPG